MLTGLGLVTVINFVYNIAVARFLGPTAFGETTAVYTLLVLSSAVTLSFQILAAKIVAREQSLEAQNVAYRNLHLRAWAAGIAVGLVLLSLRHAVSDYLNLVDPMLVVLLAIGTAFYVPLGARRGCIQGTCNFRGLAFNLVLEGLARLGGSVLLVLLGHGVRGVIAANAVAIVTAYVFAGPKLSPSATSEADVPVAFRESLQAVVFFAGQVVINNCDIVVVKHFFTTEAAGVYAAVAMVGRVVFAFCWAIVSSMFPIAAGTRSRKQEDRGVLGVSLFLVLAVCLAFALGLWVAPGWLWTELFGPQFVRAGGDNFRSLMVLYAVCTGMYALSVVLIAYEMSYKIANRGWVQLVLAGAVIVGIYLFHSSLGQVIRVQMAMMVFLLVCVALPFLGSLSPGGEVVHSPVSDPIALRRRVSEDEVIAEFLRNEFPFPEFQCPEFLEYKHAVADLVTNPSLSNQDENEVRRALLFVRHAALWREIPKGTEWFEAEIQYSDLDRIRVFPRAHWRKFALGNFAITQVAQRIMRASDRDFAAQAFLSKIERLRDSLAQNADAGAVLIIGLSETGPFTILDGNHRLLAAMLTSPEAVGRLRFLCGLSPRMAQCCWYQTNVATLLRYATNRLLNAVYDPEEKLVQLLQRS